MELNWPVVILAILVLVIGYRVWQRRGVQYISVHEVKARLAARDRLVLLDVREPGEFEAGHIPGALNVPLSHLEKSTARLDPKEETILVCLSGTRSLLAYRKLKRKGFQHIRTMEGGMRRWAWDTVR